MKAHTGRSRAWLSGAVRFPCALCWLGVCGFVFSFLSGGGDWVCLEEFRRDGDCRGRSIQGWVLPRAWVRFANFSIVHSRLCHWQSVMDAHDLFGVWWAQRAPAPFSPCRYVGCHRLLSAGNRWNRAPNSWRQRSDALHCPYRYYGSGMKRRTKRDVDVSDEGKDDRVRSAV